MATKYYAVRKGRNPGIYTTWPEAQKQVSGFKGAEFKSFPTKDEAENYISPSDTKTPDPSGLQAYVDGSYDKASGSYSYGVVLLENNEVITTLSNSDNDKKYTESFQIAGECFGALNAIRWAIKHNYPAITIFYDYMGIEKWAKKEWKTNKTVSKDYVQYYDKFATHINVHFVKVKAHTGVKYNEMADQLAKDALK